MGRVCTWVNHSVKQRMSADSWGGGGGGGIAVGKQAKRWVRAYVCVHVCLHEAVTVEKGVGVGGGGGGVRSRRERGGSAGCAWACVDHGRRPRACECV